jgi:AraC-like DNA-binding protein
MDQMPGEYRVSGEYRALRFSSDELHEPERVAQWCELYGRAMVRLDIEPLPDCPFQIDATLRTLPGLSVVCGTGSAARWERTPALIADGNDDLGLAINLGGTATLHHLGREIRLERGDATLIMHGEASTFVRASTTRFISLRMPRAALALLVPNVADAAARLIPSGTEALTLLMSYISVLRDDQILATPELRRFAVTHVHDLATLAIVATRGGTAPPQGGGVRAARLQAIKADILENLGRRGLSVSSVAGRQGVTARYVQMLFEAEGTTFSAFVLAQRLARVHRALTDPRAAGRNIGVIAAELGFGDLSYFNRAFRRRFAASPSEVRAQALRAEGR